MRRNKSKQKLSLRPKNISLWRRPRLEALESRWVMATLSGFVYLDADNDGVKDTGELGVPGAVVRVIGTANGQAVDRSTLTDDTGAYSFANLAAGTYTLVESQPEATIDGLDSTPATGAVKTNDQFANIVLTADQTIANNNFGEQSVTPDVITVAWFFASTPSTTSMLRESVALAEEAAGNDELAESIREGATQAPEETGEFAPVVVGDFDDPGLLGVRTDLLTGAPPITQTHVNTAVNYSTFSNPPTYGPHHPPLLDSSNNFITPRPTGVYSTAQPDEDLVHNLEHGHVWISYNPTLLSASDKTLLEQFITAGGTNNGVILTPRPKNTVAIAMASWAHLQTLAGFDPAAIRAFIETNRGHAPEGFIPSGQKPATDPATDTLPHTPTTA